MIVRVAFMTLVLFIPGSAIASSAIPSSVLPSSVLAARSCTAAEIDDAGVAPAVATHLHDLDASEFQRREEASRWLIANRALWRATVPKDWAPTAPEARWRWRWIAKRIDQLDRFGATIGEEPLELAATRLSRLWLEVGTPVEAELARVAASHGLARTRQRAVELLDRLNPPNLAQHLAPVARDPSPWVRRTLLDVAAGHDRAWFTSLVHESLRSDLKNDAGLAEVIRATRIHRLDGVSAPIRALWSNLGPASRVEAGLLLATQASPQDTEIFFWMIESGDYRILVDGVRAIETIVARRRGWCGSDQPPFDLARFADATLTSMFPEIRARARRWIEMNGSAEFALELVAFLDAEFLDVRQFAADRIAEWEAEDFYAELEHALLSWPAPERKLHMVIGGGEIRIVTAGLGQ